MSKDRLAWIDVLKGIGILSVVAGHIYGGVLGDMIFLFHMPLFFVIGGMLYRSPSSDRAFLKQKAVHLLIPYLSFLVLLSAKDVVAALLHIFKSPSLATVSDLFQIVGIAIYGGRLLQGWTGVFWFVTCFFLTQQLFNILYKRCSRKGWLICLAIALGVSYLNARFFLQVSFPWNVNVVFAALPFFAFGFYLKQTHLHKLAYGIAAGMTAIALWLISNGYEISYNMKGSGYGIPLITPLFSIAVIIILIGLSKLIAQYLGMLQKGLSYLGAASMVIMYLHQPIQLTLKKLETASEIRFLLASLIPVAIYFLIKERTLTRAFLLGSPQDFEGFVRPLG
ncbi:MAG: acyltransferase family protein [Timaviella obliquedivisa GSE-PSE-MK23-08B]|jgi:fucose 4-O-acetylase-like acetyltransferase|nr:acyltransferase family protein [Timaviella obliquedivisa GSE-PSE-MK23-08B]